MSGIVLAEGVVEVTADAKGVPRAIAKDIEDGESVTRAAGQNVGKQVFGGILAGWAAIGATQKIGEFFIGSISGASDLNETVSKSKTIFGNYFSGIDTWTNRSAETLGLSKAAALDAAAGFGNMFQQLGFVGQTAADMSRAVVQTSADLGSFNNLETADVADRMSAAFRGEYDSLQALIPNINAARVEQEAMAATGKTNAAELTAQEKAAAVLAIVQKDGAAAMGDFAKTADGAANKGKTATAMMEEQQSKLGGLLLPAWTGFLGFLTDTAIPGFSSLIDWMGKNGDTMLGLALVVGGAATAYWAISSAMAIHKAFMIASAAATGGLTFAQWALNAAMSANPIGLIITAIAALVAGIIWVATQTTFFQDAWAWMTEAIGTAWNWLWTTVLEPVFTAIGEVFTWIYNSIILPVVTGIMIYIGLWAAVIVWLWETVISPIFGFIGEIFRWLWENVISPVVGFISLGIQGLGLIFQWLHANVISPVFAAIGAAFSWVWNNVISPVVGFISGAITNVGNTIRSVFGGIGDFIGSAFQAALNVVRGPINGIIGLVNSAIRGLNKLSVTIPDWVPIVGGQTWGLSIPTIPMLARGSKNAPNTFIAGERGPELIVGAGGSKVYPADETRNILDRNRGGDAPLVAGDLVINEAEDPLGTEGRIAAELRKWRKR